VEFANAMRASTRWLYRILEHFIVDQSWRLPVTSVGLWKRKV